MIYLVSMVMFLSLVTHVQAQTHNWTDDSGDHDWFTPDNWSTKEVPAGGRANINLQPGPIVTDEGSVCQTMIINNDGVLTIDGGTLHATGWISNGRNANGNGTINVISGSLTTGWLGNGWNQTNSTGTINVTGGTVTCTTLCVNGNHPENSGYVNLHGGVITANVLSFDGNGTVGGVGTLDITAGTLILNGDQVELVQGFIDDPNGWITAYDGNGGILQLDYDVTNVGKTTLKAVHKLKPNPADGVLVSPGAVELSWTLPDPCVPGQPVLVDVYFTDDRSKLEEFTDPAAIQVVSKQNVTSVVVQTQPKTRYYWAVDTYIGDPNDPIWGPIFSFYADNAPPEVDGKDVVTWLVDGVRTSNLDGTVTDDGAIMPYTVQWTVVSEPNDPNSPDAVITDPSAEDTSITLSALGEYVLQLEAFDGEYTSSDTVTINVYNDGCEAAQSLPDYVPLVGDLNGDCKVDDVDLALLQENWLQDNSLTEEWFKVE